jgi:hypothetical protein
MASMIAGATIKTLNGSTATAFIHLQSILSFLSHISYYSNICAILFQPSIVFLWQDSLNYGFDFLIDYAGHAVLAKI